MTDEIIFTYLKDSVYTILAFSQNSENTKLLIQSNVQDIQLNKHALVDFHADFHTKVQNCGILPLTEMERNVVTIDKDVVQYIIYYSVTRNMFDKFLSVVEDMVKSSTVIRIVLFCYQTMIEHRRLKIVQKFVFSHNLPELKKYEIKYNVSRLFQFQISPIAIPRCRAGICSIPRRKLSLDIKLQNIYAKHQFLARCPVR